MRLRLSVQALSELAPVELAVVNSAPGPAPYSGGLKVERVQRFSAARKLSWSARLKWLLKPSIPLDLVGFDHDQQREDFAAWISEYSLVWVVRSSVYYAVRPALPLGVPVVVDIDDLESMKLRDQLAVRRSEEFRAGLVRLLAAIPPQIQGRWNVAAWNRFDRRVAQEVATVVVCSEEDARTLKATNVAIVPNGYVDPVASLGRSRVSGAPVILLQGSLTYAPNVDAAEFFVSNVLPRLTAVYPDLLLRLVGRVSDKILNLAGAPNVKVTGFVPEIEEELAKADLIVAPIRFGGGTRIKILEAFAHGIPVVSTTLGAHGLGAVDGVHLLKRDDSEGFAEACLMALEDNELRTRLRVNGRLLYERQYSDSVVKESIVKAVRQVSI